MNIICHTINKEISPFFGPQNAFLWLCGNVAQSLQPDAKIGLTTNFKTRLRGYSQWGGDVELLKTCWKCRWEVYLLLSRSPGNPVLVELKQHLFFVVLRHGISYRVFSQIFYMANLLNQLLKRSTVSKLLKLSNGQHGEIRIT